MSTRRIHAIKVTLEKKGLKFASKRNKYQDSDTFKTGLPHPFTNWIENLCSASPM